LNLHWPAGDVGAEYLHSLTQEIQLIGCQLGGRQPVDHFHLRGTTPAFAQVQQLMAQLHERFNFLDHDRGDYCVDLDPGHTDWATMGLLREQGFEPRKHRRAGRNREGRCARRGIRTRRRSNRWWMRPAPSGFAR